jgi:hypothetical protein
MLTLANIFILFLGAGTLWIGVAALVQKRSIKRRNESDRSSNLAA